MKLDTENIKQANSIAHVCQKLGLDIEKGSKILCPFHSEKTPSCHINISNDRFHCFGCNESGDILDLVMKIKGVDFKEALQFFGGKSSHTSKASKKPISKANKNIKGYSHIYSSFINMLNIPTNEHYLVKDRGVSQNVLAQCDVKNIDTSQVDYKASLLSVYSEHDLIACGLLNKNKEGNTYFVFYSACCVFPFYQNDRVVYIQGRNKPDSPFKTMNIASNVPSIYIPKHLQAGNIWLCEGIITALSFQSMGMASIALVSSNSKLNDNDLTRLLKYKDRAFLLCPDNDSMGVEAMEHAKSQLVSKGFNCEWRSVPFVAKELGINRGRFTLTDFNDILKIKRVENG